MRRDDDDDSLKAKLTSSKQTILIFQDSFYKYHNEEELALAHANLLDFDHPDAIDMSLFASVRALIKFGCITPQLIDR